MRRARKCRSVKYPPQRLTYKPAGVPGNMLQEIELTVDEYEAIRLADYEELEHAAAALQMGISRPTFTRLVKRARHKIGIFLVECRKLEINGGNFHFSSDIANCENCGAFIRHPLTSKVTKCPNCGSEDIVSMAAKLGHGDCCKEQIDLNKEEKKKNK